MQDALTAALAAMAADFPFFLELVVGAIVTYLAALLRTYTKIKIEDAILARVRQALANGARAALESKLDGAKAADYAVAHVVSGLPGTVKKLRVKGGDKMAALTRLAMSELNKIKNGGR